MSRQAILPFVPTLTQIPSDPAVEPLLRRALLRREPVVLGAAGADPYSVEAGQAAFVPLPASGAHARGGPGDLDHDPLGAGLQTLSLLTELDQRHVVGVDVPVPAVDPELVRRIEPREPEPEARFWAVSQLASEGITTRVVVKPVLPGVNDGEDALRTLFEAASDAGLATSCWKPSPPRSQLALWPGARKSGLGREALLTTFRRLRLEHGFPRAMPGRG